MLCTPSLTVHSSSFHVPGRIATSQSKLYCTNTDYIRQNRTVHQRNDRPSRNIYVFNLTLSLAVQTLPCPQYLPTVPLLPHPTGCFRKHGYSRVFQKTREFQGVSENMGIPECFRKHGNYRVFQKTWKLQSISEIMGITKCLENM